VAYNIFGGIAAPLLNRSGLQARMGIAKAVEAEAFAHYQKKIIQGYAEVRTQLARIQNLDQVYRYRHREVEVLENAIETSMLLFKTGRATYLEVIITQENLISTQISLAIVRKQQLQARVDLYRALGGGWQ
jgi:outer membrane protein, multidrug efflux system